MSNKIPINNPHNYRDQIPGFRFWLVIWELIGIWDLYFGIYLKFYFIIAAIKSTIETRFSYKTKYRIQSGQLYFINDSR